MSDDERKQHILLMWKRALNKGRGGALIKRFFNELNRKIYLFGLSKRLEDIEMEEKPSPFVIQVGSKVQSYWNVINILLLLYTAIYMPFKISFIDDETTV
jgi:hypothetical protein